MKFWASLLILSDISAAVRNLQLFVFGPTFCISWRFQSRGRWLRRPEKLVAEWRKLPKYIWLLPKTFNSIKLLFMRVVQMHSSYFFTFSLTFVLNFYPVIGCNTKHAFTVTNEVWTCYFHYKTRNTFCPIATLYSITAAFQRLTLLWASSQYCLWIKTVGCHDNRGLQGRNLHDTIA